MNPRPSSVYLFGTCLLDGLRPQAGLAALRLLRAAGLEVVFPQEQTCCGQPAFNSGYRREALAVARAQLACLSRDIPVVVPSASCSGMIRNHWPALFAGEPDAAQAEAVAARTWELCGFLVEVLDLQPEDRGEPVRVALHHSCSARRETRSHRHAETLLDRLEGVACLQPVHAEECCGFGGTFAIKQPELSAAMAGAKCDEILALGADRLLSQDWGCLMNLEGLLRARGESLPVMHLAEFLWERTR